MTRANFSTVATILALHIDGDAVNELHGASQIKDPNIGLLLKLAEAPIVSKMHDAYEAITSSPTPLHVYPIFVGALKSFLEHKGYANLGAFLHSVHSDLEQVKEDLAKIGVIVEILPDGVAITTKDIEVVDAPKETISNNVTKLH